MTVPRPLSTHPSSRQFGAGVALIRCLPADEVADPYSARLPSSPIGEKSRRAPVGRGAADERGVVLACTSSVGAPSGSGSEVPAAALRSAPSRPVSGTTVVLRCVQ